MNCWKSVIVAIAAPFLLQCSEKKEVTTTESSTTMSSSTMGLETNPSATPAQPEPVPAVMPAPPQPTPAVASGTSGGPPLRNPASTPPVADPGASARRINLRDAELLVASGDAILVDVRSEADYAKSHLRGAINIPVSQVQSRASELPRDKMIITYCT